MDRPPRLARSPCRCRFGPLRRPTAERPLRPEGARAGPFSAMWTWAKSGSRATMLPVYLLTWQIWARAAKSRAASTSCMSAILRHRGLGHPAILPLASQHAVAYSPAPALRRSVAQLVEHRSPKPRAGGSSPSTPANALGEDVLNETSEDPRSLEGGQVFWPGRCPAEEGRLPGVVVGESAERNASGLNRRRMEG